MNIKKLPLKIINKCMLSLAPTWPNAGLPISTRFNGKYILLFTHPNSGSTALSEIVGRSMHVSGLKPKFEGQWLIKGMSNEQKWDPEYLFNWQSIINTWNLKAQIMSDRNANVRYIFEKSPPNLMRADNFIEYLKPIAILTLVRNPYATISSMLHRYNKRSMKYDFERTQTIERLTKNWIARNKKIYEISQKYETPIIRYENFCSDPTLIIKYLPDDLIHTLDFNTAVSVKDYKPQKIVNMNKSQIEKLRINDIALIRNLLSQENLSSELFYEAPNVNQE